LALVDLGGAPLDRTMELDAHPLAVWIRRFLIVAGYAIGVSGMAQTLLLPFVWRPAFDSLRLYGALKPIYLLFLFASSASPVLLLIGIWGFHQRKRWARRLLLIYIVTYIGGTLGLPAVACIAGLRISPDRVSTLIGVGLIQFVELINPCIYPLLLLLCLMRSELRDKFADSRPGFTPLLNSHSSTTDERPSAAEVSN
jgi:hypothetical protein